MHVRRLHSIAKRGKVINSFKYSLSGIAILAKKNTSADCTEQFIQVNVLHLQLAGDTAIFGVPWECEKDSAAIVER